MAKSISIPITGNAAPLRRVLDRTAADVSSFGSKVGKSFATLGKVAAIGAGAAAAGAVAFGKAAFSAAETASTSNARIQSVAESMGLFGDQAQNVSDRLIGLANDQARLTGVNQNAIKESQALLLTFGEVAETADEVGGAFDRATALTLDLAAAGFGSATDNAKQLGKALNDPVKGISALSRSGVTFTEQQKDLIAALVESGDTLAAQDLILSEIEKQVGGTAAATANASDRIKVAFSQITERIGLLLMPAFERMTNFVLNTVVPGIEKLVDAFEQDGLMGVLRMVGDWIGQSIGTVFGKLWEWAQAIGAWFLDTGLPWLTEKAADLAAALWGWVQTDGVDALKQLGKWAEAIGSWFVDTALPYLGEKAADLAGALWGWVQTDGLDTIVKLGEWVAALGSWLVNTGLPTLAAKADELAAALIGWITPQVGPTIDKLVGWLNGIGDWFANEGSTMLTEKAEALVNALWAWIGGEKEQTATEGAAEDLAASFAEKFVKELLPALVKVNVQIAQAIRDGLAGAARTAGKNVVSDFVSGFSSGDFGALGKVLNTLDLGSNLAGKISGALGFRANGGPVSAGSPYIVGERGPELFMPHTAGTIVPNGAILSTGGAGSVTINVTMPAGSDGQDVLRALQTAARRTGTLPLATTQRVR